MNDLLKAIETGNDELVRSLIEGGIDVNKTYDTPFGIGRKLYPLHWLVHCVGNTSEIVDEELQMQRSQCQFRILDMLIHAGADVNAINYEGDNALHMVFETIENYDIEFVEALLKHGCDVNATYHCPSTIEEEGTSLLHLALNGDFEEDEDLDLIKLLLNYGADANKKNSYGWNAIESYLLNDPSGYCYYDYDESEIYGGINPNVVKLFSLDNIGMSPLHRSSIFDEYDDFCELASKPGVDVNAVDKLGNTPLLYAVFLEHNDLLPEDKKSKIKLLLSLGANISRRYNSSESDKKYRITDLPSDSEYQKIYDILVQKVAIECVTSGPSRMTKYGPKFDLMKKLKIEFYEGTPIYDDYFTELRKMSRYRLIDNTSIFDLLDASPKKSAIYAKNKQLIKALEISLSEKRFPIYQEWIFHTNFGLILERRKLLEPAAIKLCSILKFADPTDEFYEKTLSYLSTRDLKVLLGVKGISVKDLIMRESLLDCNS